MPNSKTKKIHRISRKVKKTKINKRNKINGKVKYTKKLHGGVKWPLPWKAKAKRPDRDLPGQGVLKSLVQGPEGKVGIRVANIGTKSGTTVTRDLRGLNTQMNLLSSSKVQIVVPEIVSPKHKPFPVALPSGFLSKRTIYKPNNSPAFSRALGNKQSFNPLIVNS